MEKDTRYRKSANYVIVEIKQLNEHYNKVSKGLKGVTSLNIPFSPLPLPSRHTQAHARTLTHSLTHHGFMWIRSGKNFRINNTTRKASNCLILWR